MILIDLPLPPGQRPGDIVFHICLLVKVASAISKFWFPEELLAVVSEVGSDFPSLKELGSDFPSLKESHWDWKMPQRTKNQGRAGSGRDPKVGRDSIARLSCTKLISWV